jgi:hypothetical protein
MSLDRDAARKYALKFWNRACDDDRIGVPSGSVSVADKRKSMKAPASEGWEVFFVADKNTRERGVFRRTKDGKIEDMPDPVVSADDLEDCTHYVSKCLLNGGVTLTETYRANELITALIGASYTKVLGERVARSEGQKIVDSGIFKVGDAIGFFNKSKGDRYSHSAMFVGADTSDSSNVGGLTCHSSCRFGGLTGAWNGDTEDAWFLYDKDGQSYTLIHLSEDDSALLPLTMKWLTGWWQMGNVFYFVDARGIAQSTTKKPKNAKETLAHSNRYAYLFQGHDQITFIWRDLHGGGPIQVETWSAGTKNQSTVKVQIGTSQTTASRLF